MFSLTLNNIEKKFTTPQVMGIVNATPDSFYNESRKNSNAEILFTVEKMLQQGATFIDVGGQSTRPNSQRISADEELQRVIPFIENIHQHFPEAIISIDTYYSQVAKKSIEAGANIINDISAGSFDTDMLPTVAALNVPYIGMHIKGTLETMHQSEKVYSITNDVYDYFVTKTNIASELGIKNYIIDIGFGFSKTIEQNFELIKELKFFHTLHQPLLIGVSRKSSIYKTLGITANEALNGTTVLNTIAIKNGAAILRVHDVKEAMECIKLCEYL